MTQQEDQLTHQVLCRSAQQGFVQPNHRKRVLLAVFQQIGSHGLRLLRGVLAHRHPSKPRDRRVAVSYPQPFERLPPNWGWRKPS